MTLAQTYFGNTPAPVPARDADPVVKASSLLHEAARLPFSTTHVRAWRTEFADRVRAASDALWRHAIRSSSPGSALATVAAEPRLLRAAEAQASEHSLLLSRVDHLRQQANETSEIDTRQAVELMEEALEIEQALQRHYDQMVSLVYEATNRVIGGQE